MIGGRCARCPCQFEPWYSASSRSSSSLVPFTSPEPGIKISKIDFLDDMWRRGRLRLGLRLVSCSKNAQVYSVELNLRQGLSTKPCKSSGSQVHSPASALSSPLLLPPSAEHEARLHLKRTHQSCPTLVCDMKCLKRICLLAGVS